MKDSPFTLSTSSPTEHARATPADDHHGAYPPEDKVEYEDAVQESTGPTEKEAVTQGEQTALLNKASAEPIEHQVTFEEANEDESAAAAEASEVDGAQSSSVSRRPQAEGGRPVQRTLFKAISGNLDERTTEGFHPVLLKHTDGASSKAGQATDQRQSLVSGSQAADNAPRTRLWRPLGTR